MGTWVTLRAWLRVAAIGVWTTSLFFVRCLSLPIAPLSRTAEEWWRRQWLHIWGVGTCWIVRLRLTVLGTPPKPPYYLVTNHLTNVDLVVLSRTVGCVFVSRADVEHMGLLGVLAKGMNTLFIDRAKVRDTKRVNDQIDHVLDRGYGIHFFAEGGISTDGEVHPFKPPLLEPAVRRGMPVHYAAITYRTPPGSPPARESVVWGEGISVAQSILQVLKLPSFEATIHFGDGPLTAPDRKQLAHLLYQATLEKFTPLG